jgi:hypothetical protein
MDLSNTVTCEILQFPPPMCQLVLPLCQLAEPRFIQLREQRQVPATRNKVRFSDNDTVEILTAPRSENTKSVKAPYVKGDFREFQCTYGGYIENVVEKSILIANNITNGKISPVVEEHIISLKEVQECIKKNYLFQPDPVAYSSTELLMDFSKVQDYPMEFLIDCVIYMMEIYDHLQEANTMFSLSYKKGIVIQDSQKSFLKRKIEEIIDAF